MRSMLMAGLAVGAFAVPAMAQTPAPVSPTENDLRCVAVLSAVIGNLADGEQRSQVMAGTMYFIGRVEGAAPRTDLKAELKRIVPTLNAEVMADEAKRCGAILVEKGTQLQAIGSELAGAK